ncbi:hypothetical protein OGAPHI_000472 [Ogataea philodendri]|uniref:GPI transamidase component GPI16 n=1 Tax=Ogataea philodendri TaxID=1378263 RepID=A0A9P8PHB3_9ASCO|nr:uncharacterized protein OGAPHI_000472 [Ogataea philodendri]KAH3671249.1 hypothetical protein OGAPHI_000472 [Ogataea philodendri]
MNSAVLVVLLLVRLCSATLSYPFEESLEFKPLKSNNLLASFNFKLNSSEFQLYQPKGETLHYSVFSKLLGPILQETNTRELHLRFSQGWYDAEVYGELPAKGGQSGGTGVELWSVIEGTDDESVFHDWIRLVNSLSGLFCASLNFIDSDSTTYPVTVFQPKSQLLQQNSLENDLYLLRSALPREPVCTENLTPFLKLLPTKGKAGISSLLTGHKVFNSQWSSMSIDITTHCSETGCHYEMDQSIKLILNVPLALERNEMPIPKPTPGSKLKCDPSKFFDAYHCFPLDEVSELDYSLLDLFGKQIQGGALISNTPTKVCADINKKAWNIDVNSSTNVDLHDENGKTCFTITDSENYNIHFKSSNTSEIAPLPAPPIYASRSLSGYSQDSGGFRIDLTNPTDEDSKIIIFESTPWFVRIYLHTLTITVNSTNTYTVDDPEFDTLLNGIIYNPAIDRKKPSHLELLVTIPAHTKVKLALQFDKSMLLYAEYPPDANHGFEIEPAVISVLDKDTNDVVYQMRTTTALLTLPTPDFSMPYNVIILTSTVMSLAFGAIFNLLIKRTVTEEEAERKAKSASSKIRDRLKQRVQSVKNVFKR